MTSEVTDQMEDGGPTTDAPGGVGWTFDPGVDYSPFRLYGRLRSRSAPVLLDLRGPGVRPTLVSAQAVLAGEVASYLAGGTLVVLFDEDGTGARALALALRRRGRSGVRALYGGLSLWRLCFPKEVVGETFLVD